MISDIMKMLLFLFFSVHIYIDFNNRKHVSYVACSKNFIYINPFKVCSDLDALS